ncbi:probable 2-carboxy-D-arabinitol-1-phosphatase isoform X4 [Magnolia sinica]|uniref:probable 2-carboxy-D-arabinitol-1-phosphatase isoform X4 n=1 Tax=Magnolia sinica TaxID=86752 RepID=UPI002658C76E|nr:probable 2-carboxy-D-arabinitol-1-phosphatase isoform X4 [Magnolia sinica]
MGCASLIVSTPPHLGPSASTVQRSHRFPPRNRSPSVLPIRSSSNSDVVLAAADQLEKDASMTGGAYDFKGATTSLTYEPLSSSKKVTLVRHGLSSWNQDSRIQGSSNLSLLTDTGVSQAEKCRKALSNLRFDQCFASPISRAKNLEAVDAKKKYPELYTTWREDPVNFNVNGIYPVRKLWGTAREAWREILSTPGENFLVVTHKSILRALICTALGLGPERFRAVDVNNGGICVFAFNSRGEAMLQSMNMTAHMYSDHVYDY